MLKCENHGCQNREYTEEENHDTRCRHHPGVPVFHDAGKGWSCCKKRVYDFQEFLDMPGCTTGRCCNIKPKDRERPQPEPDKEDENSPKNETHKIPEMAERDHRQYGQENLIKAPPLEHEMKKLVMERPPSDTAKLAMRLKVADSLKSAVEKAKVRIEEEREKAKLGNKAVIANGTVCFRAGCNLEYPNYSKCVYHPGQPVFHDGLKFWDCCERKTTDFNNMLNQQGCSSRSDHKWTGLGSRNILKVRDDFFQHGDNAVVTLFIKHCLIETLVVEASPVALHLCVEYEAGLAKLEFSVEFFGIVDLDHSATRCQVTPTKIEIQFRKKQLIRWQHIHLTDTEIQKVTTSLETDTDEPMEAIELKDDFDGESSDIDDFLQKPEEKEVDFDEIDNYM